MITLNIDNEKLQGKPQHQYEYGSISDRLRCANAICAIDPEELIDAVKQGITFTPAQIGGDIDDWKPYAIDPKDGKRKRIALMNEATGQTYRVSDFWISQQVIAIDIDNQTEDHQKIDAPIDPEDAIGILAYYDIKPYCIYASFNDAPKWRRYRIVLVLDEPITDFDQAKDLINRCAGIFNHPIDNEGYFKTESDRHAADESIEPVKLFLGGKPDCIIDRSMAITSLEALNNALPLYRTEKPQIEQGRDESDNSASNSASAKMSRTDGMQSDADNLADAFYSIDADLLSDAQRISLAASAINCGFTFDDFCSLFSNPDTSDAHRYRWNSLTGGNATELTIYKFARAQGWHPEAKRISDKAWDEMVADFVADAKAKDQDAKPAAEAQDAQEGKKDSIKSADQFEEFMAEIQTERFKPVPTGIYELDRALSGGFERKSLVTLAAAPGMGKTAIAQFLLENMAEKGHRVIYCNLEMDRSQLLCRSISRISHKLKNNGIITKDVTALDVRRGYKWNDDTRRIVNIAADYYRKYIVDKFLYITANPENSGSVTNKLSDIIGKLKKIADALQKAGLPAPLICIDYLQFIEYDDAENNRHHDIAEQIKEIMRAFKIFAMQYNTIVFMIMANNRTANKDGRASMESGRDTSNIEYSADVMLGLTYSAVEDHETDQQGEEYTPERISNIIDQAKLLGKDTPAIAKRVSLKVVKNRQAASRGSARFEFEDAYCYYRSIDYYELQQAREQQAAQQAEAKRQQDEQAAADELDRLQEAIASCAKGDSASLQAVSDYMNISKREVMQIVQRTGYASISNNKIHIPKDDEDQDRKIATDAYFQKQTPKAGIKPKLK